MSYSWIVEFLLFCWLGVWYTMSHIQKFWQTITNLKKLWLPTKAIPLSVRAHGTTWSISHFLFKEKQSFVMSKWIIARIVSLLNSICGGQAFRNNCLFVHLVCLGAQTPGGKDPLRSCLQKIVFVFFFCPRFSSSRQRQFTLQARVERPCWIEAGYCSINYVLQTSTLRIKFLPAALHQNMLPFFFAASPQPIYIFSNIFLSLRGAIWTYAKTINLLILLMNKGSGGKQLIWNGNDI